MSKAKLLKFEGLNKAYPPGSFFINWYLVKVIVGKPISCADYPSDDEFKNAVYNWFVKSVDEYEAGQENMAIILAISYKACF